MDIIKQVTGCLGELKLFWMASIKSPREKVDMVIAYPQFQLWATSSGTENTTWYMAPVDANVLDIFE